MEKKIIETSGAPAPIGPYSQAVQYGDLLFVSGQIPLNPATGELVQGSIEAETEMVMLNIKAVLEASGCGFGNVLKSTIFVTDMEQFARINAIYGKYFPVNPPARETVQVAGLPKGVNVEISVIAGK